MYASLGDDSQLAFRDWVAYIDQLNASKLSWTLSLNSGSRGATIASSSSVFLFGPPPKNELTDP